MTDTSREAAYLIVKRSLYYRPNAQGYTGIKDEAGRYTLDEVSLHFPNMESPNQDGMTFMHENDAPEYSPACCHEIRSRHQESKIRALLAERDRYKARAERAEETLEFYADENRFGLPSEGPWGVGSVDFGRKARNTLAQKTGDLLTDAAQEAANHPMIDWKVRAERAEMALVKCKRIMENRQPDKMPDGVHIATETLAQIDAETAEPCQPTVQEAARILLGAKYSSVSPHVLNAVSKERDKWSGDPGVKRGNVPDETITLSMFESCLRAIAEGDNQ